MSQQALASKADLATRTVARIEGGEDTSVRTITAIAEALDIPVADLLAPAETAS